MSEGWINTKGDEAIHSVVLNNNFFRCEKYFAEYVTPVTVAKTDAKKQTLLHYIAAFGLPQQATMCLQSGANINATSQAGRTPLHYAAASGNRDMCAFLLAHGAWKGWMDTQGYTAYDLAIKMGFFSCLEILG